MSLEQPFFPHKKLKNYETRKEKVDYLKLYKQQVNSTTKLAIDLMQTSETLKLKQSLPILGDSYITSRIWVSVEPS